MLTNTDNLARKYDSMFDSVLAAIQNFPTKKHTPPARVFKVKAILKDGTRRTYWTLWEPGEPLDKLADELLMVVQNVKSYDTWMVSETKEKKEGNIIVSFISEKGKKLNVDVTF